MGEIRLPYIDGTEQLLFLFFILARVTGLIVISPLLSNGNISLQTRNGIIFFTTGLIAMTIYPQYFGESAKYVLPEIPPDKGFSLLLFFIALGKEFIVGFLIGFCFFMLFEALLLAGQLVGVMVGLSIAELIDPVSGTSQSIIAQFFTLSVSLIILCLDYHHIFIRMIGESFAYVPIGHYQTSPELVQAITAGSARTFHYALQYSAIPYLVLFLVTFALGFMARVMPEMNIFMVGFPLKIFIGYYGVIASLAYFPLIFKQGFNEYVNLAHRVMVEMTAK